MAAPDRTALQNIRELVHKLVPDVTETTGYGMPCFKYKGKYLLSFGAFKDHLSIFPGAEPVDVFKDELKGFATTKGTIQFTLEKPIPQALLTKIIQNCQARIDAGAKY